jgi:phosphohistidine phosphatase SixA
MKLIVMRHAEREDGVPDYTKPLTPGGRHTVQAIAEKMRDKLGAEDPIEIVLSSPQCHAIESAELVAAAFQLTPSVVVESILDPDNQKASMDDLLSLLHKHSGKRCILLVGHYPRINQIARDLKAGAHPSSIPFGGMQNLPDIQKGGACCLHGPSPWVPLWIINP